MKYKIGDIVIINSPEYKVKNCKAIVHRVKSVSGEILTIKPIDGAIFNHENFRTYGKHNIVDGDEIKTLLVKWPEELFTL